MCCLYWFIYVSTYSMVRQSPAHWLRQARQTVLTSHLLYDFHPPIGGCVANFFWFIIPSCAVSRKSRWGPEFSIYQTYQYIWFALQTYICKRIVCMQLVRYDFISLLSALYDGNRQSHIFTSQNFYVSALPQCLPLFNHFWSRSQ